MASNNTRHTAVDRITMGAPVRSTLRLCAIGVLIAWALAAAPVAGAVGSASSCAPGLKAIKTIDAISREEAETFFGPQLAPEGDTLPSQLKKGTTVCVAQTTQPVSETATPPAPTAATEDDSGGGPSLLVVVLLLLVILAGVGLAVRDRRQREEEAQKEISGSQRSQPRVPGRWPSAGPRTPGPRAPDAAGAGSGPPIALAPNASPTVRLLVRPAVGEFTRALARTRLDPVGYVQITDDLVVLAESTTNATIEPGTDVVVHGQQLQTQLPPSPPPTDPTGKGTSR